MSMERNGVTFSRRLRGALANSVRRQSHVSSSHALILRSFEREPVQTESIEVPDIDDDDQLGHSWAVHCKISVILVQAVGSSSRPTLTNGATHLCGRV